MKLSVNKIGVSVVWLVAVSSVHAQVDVPAQQAHVEILMDQANKSAAALGEKIDQVSPGGMNFFTFGTRGTEMIKALNAVNSPSPILGPGSNPRQPEDFISRLAGNTQSEESVAWCGTNAVVGFNDSGSRVKTLLTLVSPSGSFSFNGWSRSSNAGATFVDRGPLIPDPVGFPLPAGIRFRDLGGDPVIGCSGSNFYYASLATDTTTSSGSFSSSGRRSSSSVWSPTLTHSSFTRRTGVPTT